MTFPDAVLALSPQLYYRLADPSGTTMTDSSGNSRNGTYSGSPTLGATSLLKGDSNACVDFDGTDDYCWRSSGTFLNSSTVSIVAIVRTDVTTGSAHIAGRWNTDSTAQRVRLFRSGTTFQFQTWDLFTTTTASASGVTASTSTTYFLVGVVNGTSHKIRVYDSTGLLQSATATSGYSLSSSVVEFTIGRQLATSSERHDGRMDEVAYFTSALSDSAADNLAALAV
jgi:hypothetical protein